MGMLARHSEAEIIVIGLIGERGREVQEFLQADLGERHGTLGGCGGNRG